MGAAARCDDRTSVLRQLATFLLLLPNISRAVELHIEFAALERILSEQLFTQEGRRYVRGSKTNKCSFAYLERPRVEGQAGRLLIHAKFKGRSAANFFGGCVGPGDDFDLTINAA